MVVRQVAETDLIERLRGARVYELGQPFHAEMPQLPNMPRFHLGLFRRHGDATREGGYSSAHDVLFTLNHAGTHIDALGHVSVDGRLLGGLAADAVQRGTAGLGPLGIDAVAPIIRRGVLLDVAGLLGVAALEPAFRIDGGLLERCSEAAGTAVGAGDVVMVRTGWGAFWDEPVRYVSATEGLPGVDADGAEWLADRAVFATGADCLMFERYHPSEPRLPVHARLVQGAGIHLIENMNLEAIAAAKVTECAFIALPLKLVGATGSQIRPIALV